MRAAVAAALQLFAVALLSWLPIGAGGEGQAAADPADIHTVHIVTSCHLDAGYKYPYVAQVASEWFETCECPLPLAPSRPPRPGPLEIRTPRGER